MTGTVYRLRPLILDCGERYPMLLDSNGMPHWHATLFVTTQLRNAGKAANTMMSVLAAIRVLLTWANSAGVDIEERFAQREFLNDQELESLWRYLATRRTASLKPEIMGKVVRLPRNVEQSRAKTPQDKVGVASNTLYTRISYVASYLSWLAIRLVEQNAKHVDAATMDRIKDMGSRLNARRPTKRSPSLLAARRGLSDEQQKVLLETISPGSATNPFAPALQNRNELIMLMLYHLGVRAGELLGLRVEDVDFQKNTVLIARRHGDKKDPRGNQPVAKTADRIIPIADGLARRIADYVMTERRKVPGAKRHPFLFVTHRSGPFLGVPLSIPSLIKVFAEIQRAAPEHLGSMSAHTLRHTANDRFSALMEQNGTSSAQEEKMRSYLMGWREGSGTAAVYTRRHVETAAHKAALQMQETDQPTRRGRK